MNGLKLLFIIYCSLFIFNGCTTTLDVYEKTIAFPQHSWNSKDIAKFNFDVSDTVTPYNLLMVLRHEDSYGYKNIWLNIEVKGPDSTFTVQREFTLADNTKWLGSSMDDIIEHRIKFNSNPIHLKKGTYTFSVQQTMREDPLLHVMNAGIRVEKFRQ